MHVGETRLSINDGHEIQKIRNADNGQEAFSDIIFNKKNGICNDDKILIGQYTDAKFGFDACVYADDSTSKTYTVKINFHDGKKETRELDMEKVDASNCDIIDLFAKLKYIEKTKNVDNPMSNHVLAHFYMEKRSSNADFDTKLNWRDMFQKQLELEKKNSNYTAAQKLEQILLYL